jgi:outer membrane receptor for ferrienterochelin and colicins
MLSASLKKISQFTAASAMLACATSAAAQSVNYLELEELFNEAVTTSATGKPLKASQAPVPMIIISREEIRRTGQRSLAAVLQNYAGIDVNRFGATQYEVAIRGGAESGNPRLLVLVNGRQVYLDHYGQTNWDSIGVNPEEIRQIEVIKGPNSALFGFNATSGVVNIITVNPLHEQVRSVTAGYGNGGQRDVRATGTLKLNERVGIKLSASYAEEDRLATASRLRSFPTSPPLNSETKAASVETYAKITSRTDALFSYSYGNSRGRFITPTYNAANQSFKTHGTQARVTSDTGLGLITASAFYNRLSNSFEDVVPGQPPSYFKNKVYGGQISNLFKVGSSNTFRLAAEYRNNSLKFSPNVAGETTTKVYAGSGMWDSKLSDKLNLTVAGRYDHLELGHGPIPLIQISPLLPPLPIPSFRQSDFDRSINVWSANAGVVFNATDVDTFRLSVARGTQAPSLASMGVAFPFGTTPNGLLGVLSGNPNLEPSISYTVDVGYDRTLEPINGKLRFSAFHNWVNDVIQFPSMARSFAPQPPFEYASTSNVGNFRTYGVEADLVGKLSKQFGWRLNYTYTQSKDKTDKGNPLILGALQQMAGLQGFDVQSAPSGIAGLTPRHKVNANLNYTIGPVEADLFARYRSQTRPFLQPVPGSPYVIEPRDSNVTLDARLAYKPVKQLEVSILGENLTRNRSATLTTLDAPRRVKLALTATF